jgi:hypothetical protein
VGFRAAAHSGPRGPPSVRRPAPYTIVSS